MGVEKNWFELMGGREGGSGERSGVKWSEVGRELRRRGWREMEVEKRVEEEG